MPTETRLTFTLTKDDVLLMLLFINSHSTEAIYKRKNERLNHSLFVTLLGLVVFFTQNKPVGVIFIILSGLIFLLSPRYYAKRDFKFYSKYIDTHLSDLVGHPIEISFDDECIAINYHTGETKQRISSLKYIAQVKDYCFLKYNTGSGMVIPLRQLPDSTAVIENIKNRAADHQIPFHTDLDWKWK